jgi:hypothetical protein
MLRRRLVSDFENLNNAIVRAASLGGSWGALNTAWQSDVVNHRTWEQAVPPLWAAVLESYWTKYAKLYASAPDAARVKVADPRNVAPGGLAAAVKDLYAPTSGLVLDQLDKIEAVTNAKVSAAVKQVGVEMAKGAQQQTYDWAWSLGGLAVGAGALWLMLRGGRGASLAGAGVEARMVLRIGKKKFEVGSLQEAQRIYRRERNASGEGGSTFPRGRIGRS